MNVTARLFARDLAECIRIADARKADIARRRCACKSNGELVRLLESEAARRGDRGIDWDEYFRNVGL